MSDQAVVEIGFLNIVATPHPPGVYERVLQKSAEKQVQFYGDQFAAITPPVAIAGEKGLLGGQIVIWTEIDPDAPGIKKSELSEVKLSDVKFEAPDDLGFNGRTFSYVFNAATHILVVELKNELGKTLSPARAKRIFDRLMSPEVLGLEMELVEVTVLPEDDALSRVLGLQRLDRVEIVVKRPNPDDISKKTQAVLDRLEAMNVKCEDRILTRAPGTDGIKLDEDAETLAEVAAFNGFVSSKGRDEDGEPTVASTREYPKVVKRAVAAGRSFVFELIEAARNARARAR